MGEREFGKVGPPDCMQVVAERLHVDKTQQRHAAQERQQDAEPETETATDFQVAEHRDISPPAIL